VTLASLSVRHSQFVAPFLQLINSYATLDSLVFANVTFGSTLLQLGQQTSITDLTVNGAVCRGSAGAILTAQDDGTVTADRISVTNSNAAAFNVTGDASFAISNAKFAGINVLRQPYGNWTLGGAFACMDGQLALDSVLIQGCMAQTAAAGFCAPSCQPDFQAVTLRLNKQGSSRGECSF
jgi:hypothetical protein